MGKGSRGKKPPPGFEEVRIPGWLPPLIYGVVTLLLFRKFVFSGEMLYGSDTLSLGYMARAFFAEALRGGTFPFWNPIILGGTPFLESLAGGDSLYPTSLLLLFMEPFRALGWKLILHVFLAGLLTYGWIRSLGRSQAAALLAGLAYLLAPFMVSLVWPGHDGKLFVTALTPLLFWMAERTLTGGGLRYHVYLALTVSLVILTTHFQTAYFLFGMVGTFYLFRCVQLWMEGERPLRVGRRFGAFLLASVLGAGVAGVQFLPAVQYVVEFSRRTATTTEATQEGSVEYSSSWGLHPEEVGGLVVPEFVGSNAGGAAWASDTYWGRNLFKHNHEYVGIVVLLLAGLSFLGGAKKGLRWFLAVFGCTALLYGLGQHTPVWRIFYEVVPGVSLFRAPSIAIFLFGFAAVTLAAFGLDRVAELASSGEGKGWKGASHYLWGATGLLALLTILAASGILTDLWTATLYRGISPPRAEILASARPFITRGFALATLLVAGTATVAWAYRKAMLSPVMVVVGIGILMGADAVRVDDAFIQIFDFHRWATEDANIRFLKDRQAVDEPFRVFSLVGRGQDVLPGMFGLELAGGHHPNDLARYRELIGMRGSGVPENLFSFQAGTLNVPLLATLNVRYLIWPSYQYGPLPDLEPVSQTLFADGSPYTSVYELPVLPRARLVADATVMPEEETVEYILSGRLNVETGVVLNEDPPVELEGGPVGGRVDWLVREPNRLSLHVDSDRPALLVLAENWFPAWKATVNGVEAPVLRANHTLRAIPVPEGESEVALTYSSGSLRFGLLVSLLSLLILGTGALLAHRGGSGEASEEGKG